jgi:hypothetical protein
VTRLWYLSFVGEEGFRGATIVWGRDMMDACQEAALLRCNPGGEVMGYEIAEERVEWAKQFVGTLLSRERIEKELGGVVSSSELEGVPVTCGQCGSRVEFEHDHERVN